MTDIAKLGFEADTGPIKAAATALDRLASSGDALARSARGAETSMTRLESRLENVSRLASAFRNYVVALGIVRLGQSITDTAISFQKMETALRFATGSVEGAREEIQFLRRESERLGQDFLTAGSAYAKLSASASALGLSTQEVRNIFTGVSSAATVMGLSAYEAEGAFLALQQMLAKGTVQAEELRGQLGERIPTAFSDAAAAVGMTTRQLSKALEQGQVDARSFVTKLSDYWVQKFGGEIPDATENANIAITDFGNALQEVQIAFARSGFLEGLTSSLSRVAEILSDPEVQTGAGRIGAALGDAFVYITENAETLFRVFAALAAAAKGGSIGAAVGTAIAPGGGTAVGGAVGAVAAGAPGAFSPSEIGALA